MEVVWWIIEYSGRLTCSEFILCTEIPGFLKKYACYGLWYNDVQKQRASYENNLFIQNRLANLYNMKALHEKC